MQITSEDISEILRLPANAIGYEVTRRLHAGDPGKAVLRVEGFFGVEFFAHYGQCGLKVREEVVADFEWDYHGPDEAITKNTTMAWLEVRWEGNTLQILTLTYNVGGFRAERFSWIVAADEAVGESFFKAVSDYNHEIREEILVFNGGCFAKDKELFAAIQSSSLDNLVLPGRVKEELAEDCAQFFEAREMYERYRIPWKRGYLLMGPPGNGKSHTVKALLNHLKRPCIYVQSFKSEHSTDHEVMRALFKRARVTTPCIMVLEDLDSLINDGNRAFFLNELDGFASNHGILTIATTNHPDRLDPAILERPSRFDRKYTFGLPEQEHRARYLALWNDKLESELRLSPQGLESVAQVTDNYSYAYLKELVLSSMMAWMRRPRAMDEVMLEVAQPLSQQISHYEEMPAEDNFRRRH